MMTCRSMFVWVALTIAATVLPSRDARAQLRDVAGSADHPMISRYAGSTIIGYDVRRFDEFTLPLGPIRITGSGTLTAAKTQKVEGRVSRILYVSPAERSPLEVLRNYEDELKKNGFTVLYSCERTACSAPDGWLGEYFLYPLSKRLKQTPPAGGGGTMVPGQISSTALTQPKDQRYLAAKRAGAAGDVYASVYVATQGFAFQPETAGRALVLLDVIETTPLETGMVTVDASAMAKDIGATGKVALYGIYFDTNSADVKPESTPTLQEIAKLMKQDAALKLFVVGHTDNVGGYDVNMALSQRRADAVLKELTTKHGVDAARLRAAGAGQLAPVARNDTDDGRAKNRRVELVKQ